MLVQPILGRNSCKFPIVIFPCSVATRFVVMAGVIGSLKPGRCLRPWNKSDFLDVSATVHSEKHSANNQTLHGEPLRGSCRSYATPSRSASLLLRCRVTVKCDRLPAGSVDFMITVGLHRSRFIPGKSRTIELLGRLGSRFGYHPRASSLFGPFSDPESASGHEAPKSLCWIKDRRR